MTFLFCFLFFSRYQESRPERPEEVMFLRFCLLMGSGCGVVVVVVGLFLLWFFFFFFFLGGGGGHICFMFICLYLARTLEGVGATL